MKKKIAITCIAATTAAITANAEVFSLGEVEVVGNVGSQQASDANVAVIEREQLQQNQIKRLSEIAPSTAGLYVDKKGARGEQNFYVRGFDARRVPLFIDGIPVYVPYDGNADFGRFTTFDLSRVVVSKGASSVLYGANTMGGAINLISQKPTKALEGEIGYGFERGRSSGTFGNNLDFNIGTRQDKFYFQAGGSFMQDRGQQLAKDFKADSYGNEDGNRRENSIQKDRKISLKFGYTPNATDEYVIAYTNQKGEKQQPFYTGKYATWRQQVNRFWDWPVWDKEGVYFLSHTQLNDAFYVKTKFYYDTFENQLNAYTTNQLTAHNASNAPSYYDDKTYGAGVELGWNINPHNELKFATSYKYDVHKEKNDIYNARGVKTGEEPWQKMADRTYSFGLEYTHKFSEATKLILGSSYDTRDAVSAEDYIVVSRSSGGSGSGSGSGTGRDVYGIYDFDVGKRHALNYQIALKHSFFADDELSLSYAKKTYFASMKERYSKRLGQNTPNPYLKPETAHHYEIAYAKNLTDNLRVESALFYSRVKDEIGNVNLADGTRQAQNIDTADYKGAELSATYFVTDALQLGGNYTYIRAKYKNKDALIYDLPKHKGFVYVDYQITPKFSAYLSQELVGSRYSQSQQDTKLAGFGVTDVKFTYKPVENLALEAGVSNLFDKNYEYREGFPEEGRVFFGNIRYKF
ncbi:MULTISPECIES: TonB-dependent siderophore receptor [Glaesserella]|uniref:TonB-dependent receptor n=1 Tax=Glaesserella australis TaxID=2094024 RepID=A0A328BVM3_9PAST|nr:MULTISPECIES: TonB-dependent receptor [Glaesserella]AUI65994.1 TonB-dependent receptor [Glaesserella sp. 15-184]RAL18286.1 TonB-dependent receptor [Glaesserella australis]